MSRKTLGVISAVVVVIGLVAGVASAQATRKAEFEVAFAFFVNGKELPAGTYQLEAQPVSSPLALSLYSRQGNAKTIVKVMTRLADLGGSDVRIVFDKSKDAYYLAEVHVPGMDGFDIQGAPGEHVHEKVTAKK
jgi:hypothetical protein